MLWLAVACVVVAYWFFRSPLSGAVADAIRHGAGVPLDHPRTNQELARVTEEMGSLRDDVSELAERLDFTERALAEVRRREALQHPRS